MSLGGLHCYMERRMRRCRSVQMLVRRNAKNIHDPGGMDRNGPEWTRRAAAVGLVDATWFWHFLESRHDDDVFLSRMTDGLHSQYIRGTDTTPALPPTILILIILIYIQYLLSTNNNHGQLHRQVLRGLEGRPRQSGGNG